MFHPFEIEHFLSDREQGVELNFSESGVHPLTLGELLEIAGRDAGELLSTSLNYPEVNGLRKLRERIAALYEGAGPDNVLVTVGASEANHLIASTLVEPGDEVVVQKPTYQQLSGNAVNRGIAVKTVALVEERDWALDLDELDAAVGPGTRVVAVVNPNNPTGHIFTEDEMDAVVRAAEQVGAWIVADEVYAGAERDRDQPTPSFWGRYDRVIAVNSMSKAYGLPGLRLGWVVAPLDAVPGLWRRHEYATIAASMLAMELATLALSPDVRPKLTARARRLIRHGFDVLAEGLAVHPGVFDLVPPQASAISFVRYRLPIGSVELAERLVAEQSLLVVPGKYFGLDHHFRFSSALPEPYLREGLARVNALVASLV